MFFSTIIPTIGRESLTRAVQSILSQSFAEAPFEVIVVNDSGRPLPAAPWQQDPRVRLLHTQRRERCFARNAGAAIAQGAYLHFLDDDDYLLPGAAAYWWQLAQAAPTAVWLYGAIQIVNNQGTPIATIHSRLQGNCFAQIMGGAWAPIQVSLLQRQAFWAAGGYDQRTPPVIEDLDLCRRLAYTGEFAHTEATLGCMLRDVNWGSSTPYKTGVAYNRQTRDQLLELPHCFTKMRTSARNCFWQGRVLHTYLSGCLFNLRQRRFFTAVSRGLHALATLLLALPCTRRKHFWQAVRAEHVPDTLYYALVELERTAQAKNS